MWCKGTKERLAFMSNFKYEGDAFWQVGDSRTEHHAISCRSRSTSLQHPSIDMGMTPLCVPGGSLNSQQGIIWKGKQADRISY